MLPHDGDGVICARAPGGAHGGTVYRSIVVGTDGSDRAQAAVKHAAELAKAAGATLHVVSAYKSPTAAGATLAPEAALLASGAGDAEVHDAVESMLNDVAAELRRDGVEVMTYACGYAAADALCEVAATHQADVIVVGDRGMHGARRLLGSVPNSVAHRAGCAVLIVPTS
jgi:nucleotide-binding universal stress UspA family protein